MIDSRYIGRDVFSNEYTCGGKITYLSYAAAQKRNTRASMLPRRVGRRRETLRPYRCQKCKFYHIGHPPKDKSM